MKVLLVGGSGQLGREIYERWHRDVIDAPSHRELTLEDADKVRSYVDKNVPDFVVNCAAFHNVDVCELQPGEAFAVNALAVDSLAQICQERDIGLLTVSTDYVFDGTSSQPYAETDCPRPISAYGASKLAGEHLVLRRNMKAFVVRTCGVYGTHASRSKGTFVDRIISQARAGETIRVVSDVVASPTYAGHLAEALGALVRTDAYGLFHAVNPGPVSWYDFAVKALQCAGIDRPIERISAGEWKAPARRPAYSALANKKLDALGIHMPSWDEGIAAYLSDKSL